MKVSIPAYVLSLVVVFVYGIVKYYVPDLPFSQEQLQWVFLVVLGALGVDVTNALRVRGLL